MASPLDTMQIGKLITLEQAAQRLAEKDNGCTDLRWTLRFCIESYARLCIKLPYSISTWERTKEPNDCGKCGDIADERERLAYLDTDEGDMPQYCDNCQMTNTEAGDYIGERFGVLFVPASSILALTYPETEEVRCSVLYGLDDSWSDGYCRFEVASEYHVMQWELKRTKFIMTDGNQQEYQELLDKQSRKYYLLLSLADLFVWKEDFETALQGGDAENRKSLPMNQKDAPENRRSALSKQTNKMALVIYGMAVAGFGYEHTPGKRNQLTGENNNGIPAKLQQAGINIDPESLRGYLRQGAELSRKNSQL